MDENTCMVEVARFFMSFTQRESCGKCVPCREGTKRMLEILERIVNGEGKLEDLDTLEELAAMVKSMALCGLGKSAPLPVISTLKTFRKEYEEHITEHKCVAKNCTAMRRYVINPEFCKGCGKCAKNCPVGAITGVRKEAYSIIRIFVSSVIPVGKTVHLMQFMLNIRRDNYGIYDNRRQKGRIYR